MNLRHLHAFVVVAEELSFRGAVRRLSMSQPPLSRQIKALEKEVGIRLLERDRNSRVALTDAGQTFLSDAKRTLAAAEAAVRNAREAVNGARGRLNLANIASLSTRVVPPLLEAFRVQYPQVEVFLVEMERTDQVAALREGRIHLAIYPDLRTPLDRQFQTQPLFSCPMVAVLPPGHPLAAKENASTDLDIHGLAGETVLVPSLEGSPGYIERLNHICASTDFTPAATHPVDGWPNLLGMIAAGYGIALLPEVLANGAVHACQLRRLSAPVFPFRLNPVWLRKSPSQVLQNFLAVAKKLSSEVRSNQPAYPERKVNPPSGEKKRRCE